MTLSVGGRIAALIHCISNGRFDKCAGVNHLQAFRTSLHRQGLPRELTFTLEGILDEVAGNLAHIAVEDRVKVLTIVRDGLIALARTGQQSPDLLRSYAVTKAQVLLRGDSAR